MKCDLVLFALIDSSVIDNKSYMFGLLRDFWWIFEIYHGDDRTHILYVNDKQHAALIASYE